YAAAFYRGNGKRFGQGLTVQERKTNDHDTTSRVSPCALSSSQPMNARFLDSALSTGTFDLCHFQTITLNVSMPACSAN
ncbi:MAG TPA: hypothetical protein VL424_04580, partial [Pararobbsia sp.]|nr:hypothetical protein [Pararobbsia sp.]